MWSKLEEVFEAIGLEYARQGSYTDESEYPESFFTFWNADTPEAGFYDDEAHKAVWVWYVYFYTKDPSLIYSKPDQFIKIAKEKGFIPQGKPKDLASGSPDYFGRYVQLKYIENYSVGGKTNE